MRKVHQKIGQQIKSFLQEIENGNAKTDSKRINRNTIIWLGTSSNLYGHPIELVHNVKRVVRVRYCYTDIVTVGIDKNGIMYCYINNGGYDTKTTKEYINAALSSLGFQYHLRIKNYCMQLIKDNGDIVSDFNGSYLLTKEM